MAILSKYQLTFPDGSGYAPYQIYKFGRYIADAYGTENDYQIYCILEIPVYPGKKCKLLNTPDNTGTYCIFVDANGTKVGDAIQNESTKGWSDFKTVPVNATKLRCTMYYNDIPQWIINS